MVTVIVAAAFALLSPSVAMAADELSSRDVRLDGRHVDADERDTNRGLEVTLPTSPGAEHALVVTWR